MDITHTDLERVTSDFITMVSKLGLDATAEAAQIEGRIHLNVRTPDPGRMIGRRGKTLAAIQLLLNGMARRDKENFPRVFIDIDGYRSEGKGRFEHPKSEDGEATEDEADADAAEAKDAPDKDGEAVAAVDSDSSESDDREEREERSRRSRRPRRRSSRGAAAAAEVASEAAGTAVRQDDVSDNDASSDDEDRDGESATDNQAEGEGEGQPKRRRRSRRGGRRQRNKNARANGEERGEPRAEGDADQPRADQSRADAPAQNRRPAERRPTERREDLPPLPAPPETITVQRAPDMPAATIDDVPPGPPAPPTVGRGPVGRSERGGRDGRDGRRGRGRRDSRDGDRGGFRDDAQAPYEVPRPVMASPEPVRRAEPMDDNERLRRLALDAAKEVHMWGEEKLLPPLRDEECQVVFEALSSHAHVSAEPGPKINDGRVRIVLKEKKH